MTRPPAKAKPVRLTEAQRRALEEAPYYGFPAGSNMWPLVGIFEETKEPIYGEVIDGLLREGLLKAHVLAEPILTDRTDDPELAPDCECTHDVVLTLAGRAALKESEHG